jgi:ABC-type polysaccharide/polyol phosphate export permease
MIRLLREAAGSRELFGELLKVQMDQRYNGSVLGFVWALAVPLLTILSFSVIFSGLSGWNLADYGVYFFCGYVPWSFFQASSLYAAESIVGNAFYTTRLSMPKQLLPLVAVALNGLDAVISLVILFALMPLLGAPFHASMLCLPASILLTAAAVAGVALLCAQATVFFRDFRYLLSSALFLWFFFSPVLWKPESLHGPLREFYRLNPVVPFLELFQLPIRQGAIPPAETWMLASAWSAALLLTGAMTFAGNQKRFYYYL